MRVIDYEWRLREVMAAAGMFTTTKLIPELRERGIKLSNSQIYRLATEKPERLNMHVLVALMDIFNCGADDLIHRIDLGKSAAVTGTDPTPTHGTSADFLRQEGLRPKRAKIVPRNDPSS